MRSRISSIFIAVALAIGSSAGAQTTPALQRDGSVLLGPRSVPVPATISVEARAAMTQAPIPDLPLPEMREFMRQLGTTSGPVLQARYKVKSRVEKMAGVGVTIVTPDSIPPAKRNRVLLHLHGGAFSLCDGRCSFLEAIPIAGLTQTKVVSVDYSLAPEHVFPVAVDEVVQVYRQLLKTYRPDKIALFGSSAGAILAAETLAKLKQEGLPMPAALGFFSGTADLARPGDSQSLYDARGFSKSSAIPTADYYLGATASNDPVASPIYSDLRNFPPTLLMTSTRDVFLSGTSNFERALHAAGVRTELVNFDGLYHTFWLAPDTPEAIEAVRRQADFLDRELGHRK